MIQNMGNAMSSSGLFVAPKSGKKLFALSGISKWDSFARVEFQMRTGVTSNCIKTGHAFAVKDYENLTIQNILQLG
jgi:hypothetical protein